MKKILKPQIPNDSLFFENLKVVEDVFAFVMGKISVEGKNSKERIYRDPVHNIIRIRTDEKIGELLVHLIDTAEFQRLRRIKQLGLAMFTYQGAEHSRFTHSLGVLHLINRVLEKLSSKYTIKGEDQSVIKCAALLHDIGHGAFSHVFEKILNFHHEDFTIETISSEETEIGRALKSFSSDFPERVASVIRGKFNSVALSQLVSSQLDVDRMDYLLRDSLMTGAKYGVYDLEWIIRTLEIDESRDRIYVATEGLHAVEGYLQARYYMFKQVYFHRNLRSAEVVLQSLLKRAIELIKNNGDVWFAKDTPFEKILKQQKLSLKEHLEMDDSDVIFHVKKWQSAEDKVLSDLSKRFINRRLFSALDLDMPEDEKKSFLEEARRVVEDGGFDPQYYFIEDKASDVPYYLYKADEKEPKSLILVQVGHSRPQIKEISEVSPAVESLKKAYELHRICFPSELKEKILRLYKKKT
ncbi:MAG: HD domain-containing protein [Acidobacteria bacterium]|nr:MAG: HD domain-containing protein [Acidobacteriota bacterium]